MAAKTLGVPFQSYKLISDQAGNLGACEVVREKAEEWSQQLALYLRTILVHKISEKPTYELDGFHFTFTTRHQFEQLLKKISLRDELTMDDVFSSLPLEAIKNEVLLPKERAKALLNFMDGKLDPLKDKLQSGLASWKAISEKNGISLQTDLTWESPEIKISFNVSTPEELNEKLKSLNDLKLKPFIDLRNGNLHVE